MGLENTQRISVIDPISPAIEHVRLMLFRPFDLSKWFIIGFCAWLSQLGQGGGGGGGNGWRHHDNPGFHAIREGILAHLAIIAFFAAIVVPIVIGVLLVICWVSSRGKFMFVHCVAGNKAEVVVPWNKFARHANSLFLFRLIVGIIAAITIWLPIIAAVISAILVGATAFGVIFVPGLLAAIFAIVVVAIVIALVAKFTNDFVVPIMFLNTTSVLAGWKQCLALIGANKAQMALYILLQIVISIVITFIVMAICLIGCCCCCASVLLLIPYIGTVILLPLVAFKRAYSLFYLRQFGPQFDVFSVQPA